MSAIRERAKALSFVSCEGNFINLWSVQETGDWAADNARGRECAEELLEFMRVTESPNYLGYVVEAMRKSKALGGIAIGFLHYIAVAAMGSAAADERQDVTTRLLVSNLPPGFTSVH